MIPHPIRLRHPWDELPGSEAGKIAYRRKFQRPTNLDAWERVTLEIDRAIYSGEVRFNSARSVNFRPASSFQSTLPISSCCKMRS